MNLVASLCCMIVAFLCGWMALGLTEMILVFGARPVPVLICAVLWLCSAGLLIVGLKFMMGMVR